MKKRNIACRSLSFDQLYDGYSKSIESGERLLNAGSIIYDEYPEIALGVFELGQEEIGKSLTFLASFMFIPDNIGWEWFWKRFRDHTLKVHRAFFYELFSPLRVEIHLPEGKKVSGGTQRDSIKQEKEAAFYVEYHDHINIFTSPKDTVSSLEVLNRYGTLLCLVATAKTIKHVLDEGDKKSNYMIFSELALRACSENIYQQDMPEILDQMSARSEYHNQFISRLKHQIELCQKKIMRVEHESNMSEG